MINTLEKAIELLAKNITASTNSDGALNYTQAVLNLTHAAATWNAMKAVVPAQ